MHSYQKAKQLKSKAPLSYQYASLRRIQMEELGKEHLRLLAALYGHLIENGDRTLKNYEHFTMADLSQEIIIRTILLEQQRLRRENKNKEEEKPKEIKHRSNKILDQLVKETSGST